MNVLQMVSGTGLNGAVRHCYDLSCQLALRGHFVWIAHKPGSWIAKQPLPPNVALLETTLKRNRSELTRLAAESARRGIDVVHTHNSSSHFFGVLLARLYGLRVVATCHMPHLQPHWWWNDRVIAPTQSTARFQRWVNWVPRHRMDVIPNFVDASRLQPTQSQQETLAELGFGAEEFVISVVGEVCTRKSQHTLIEALPELVAVGIAPRLLLIGKVDAKYGEKCSALIRRLGLQERVAMLGQRRDIGNLLSISHCVCLPSKKEVMPLSLLEAMSIGLPVIVTAAGGVDECVRDGTDGFIVERNPHAFSEGLIALARNPQLRERLGENARRSMQSQFSPDVCLAKVEATYRAACAPTPRLIAS
ncbi:MAG: glycosyltransferase family 4 protein [Planctomycetaceae bacterium]